MSLYALVTEASHDEIATARSGSLAGSLAQSMNIKHLNDTLDANDSDRQLPR